MPGETVQKTAHNTGGQTITGAQSDLPRVLAHLVANGQLRNCSRLLGLAEHSITGTQHSVDGLTPGGSDPILLGNSFTLGGSCFSLPGVMSEHERTLRCPCAGWHQLFNAYQYLPDTTDNSHSLGQQGSASEKRVPPDRSNLVIQIPAPSMIRETDPGATNEPDANEEITTE